MGGELIDELRDIVRPQWVRDSAFDAAVYRRDGSLMNGEVSVAVLPGDADEVRRVVSACARHGQPFVARGSGTGLAGGAVPRDGAVVVGMGRLDRIVEVDLDDQIAWVEPGVLNLDLSVALRPQGLHFAPDPSSQSVCSIGGNIANNAGGPHCLAYGVTSAHVLAVEVVLPDGRTTVLGGLDPEPSGYDLRGVFVGSEGTLGIATKVAVRLMPNPPDVRTLLLDFADVRHGAAAVSGIIAAGVVPAALEMMDGPAVQVIERFAQAGYPLDADAVLLVEVDGLSSACDADVEVIKQVAKEHGVRTVRLAADDTERALLWKGRKAAFGAVASLAPDYYLHDTVVPRTRLLEVLDEVYAIAERYELQVVNVFHAGDGNLHPILAFDSREPGALERVQAAGEEIVRASLDAGGVLSGEHGIGLEKRDLMPLLFSAHDLELQDRLRAAFDPASLANPHKVIPDGSRCGDLHSTPVPAGAWV